MKKQTKSEDDDTLDTSIEDTEDTSEEDMTTEDDGIDFRADFAGALKRARKDPKFKEAVFSACDAARSAAAHALLEYAKDSAALSKEMDGLCMGRLHYFEWAVREAASRRFLRTIHKRFPFSEVGDIGDAS